MISEAVYKTLQYLSNRKGAYAAVFQKDNPAAQAVLQDLAKLCRADRTCFHPDPRLHALAEGRREVWLRIANHLNLTSEQLYELLGGTTSHGE